MIHNNTFHRISEFLVGLLFGLGLMLSGMTDPGKVIGFLDLFGGWAGFCPGPALVSMADGQPKAMMFVVAMLVGMLGFELMDRFIHAPRKAKFNPV